MFKVGDIVTIKDQEVFELIPHYKSIFTAGKEFEVTETFLGGTIICLLNRKDGAGEYSVLAKRFQLSNGIIHLLSQEELNRIKNLNR